MNPTRFESLRNSDVPGFEGHMKVTTVFVLLTQLSKPHYWRNWTPCFPKITRRKLDYLCDWLQNYCKFSVFCFNSYYDRICSWYPVCYWSMYVPQVCSAHDCECLYFKAMWTQYLATMYWSPEPPQCTAATADKLPSRNQSLSYRLESLRFCLMPPLPVRKEGKEEYLYSTFLHQGTHRALRHGSYSFTCK